MESNFQARIEELDCFSMKKLFIRVKDTLFVASVLVENLGKI